MLEHAEPLTLCLYVRSLAEAKRFYGDTLGLPLLREEPAEALHFAAGGAVLTLRLADATDLPPRGSRLVFTLAADFEAVCDELRRRGVVFDAPARDRPSGRVAILRDPDGHELWLFRPSATETQFHRWQETRRLRARRVPVQRRPKVRRHEPEPRSARSRHPAA